jgi:hypothetical protein
MTMTITIIIVKDTMNMTIIMDIMKAIMDTIKVDACILSFFRL